MSKKRIFSQLIGLFALGIGINSVTYAAENFSCPSPQEIQNTDFTEPSIWVAPPVAHSVPGAAGVGLGGSKAIKLVGVEEAEVRHHAGWVCVYSTEGSTVREYQAKIIKFAKSNKYLAKYLKRVREEFDNAEPYLKKYAHSPVGFIGYEKAQEN